MQREKDRAQRIAHWSIRVTGTVQGVFFRAGAAEEARALGLAGEARNLRDGSVLIEVEGPVAQLERFRAWCRYGPPRAKVIGVDVEEGLIKHYPPGTFKRS
jgi:acylphosphatase